MTLNNFHMLRTFIGTKTFQELQNNISINLNIF